LGGRRGKCRAGGWRLRDLAADVVAVTAAADAVGQQRAVRIVGKPGLAVLREPELRRLRQRVSRTAGRIGFGGRAILVRWNRWFQSVHRWRRCDRIVGSGCR
jgi:hypothetical protein